MFTTDIKNSKENKLNYLTKSILFSLLTHPLSEYPGPEYNHVTQELQQPEYEGETTGVATFDELPPNKDSCQQLELQGVLNNNVNNISLTTTVF